MKRDDRLEAVRAEVIGGRFYVRAVQSGALVTIRVTRAVWDGNMILLAGTDDAGQEWTTIASPTLHQITRVG